MIAPGTQALCDVHRVFEQSHLPREAPSICHQDDEMRTQAAARGVEAPCIVYAAMTSSSHILPQTRLSKHTLSLEGIRVMRRDGVEMHGVDDFLERVAETTPRRAGMTPIYIVLALNALYPDERRVRIRPGVTRMFFFFQHYKRLEDTE